MTGELGGEWTGQWAESKFEGDDWNLQGLKVPLGHLKDGPVYKGFILTNYCVSTGLLVLFSFLSFSNLSLSFNKEQNKSLYF